MEPITATVDDLWCRAAELHAAGCEAEAAGEWQRIHALTGDPQAAYALALASIKAGDDLDDARALLMAARARARRDIDIALLLAAIDVQTGRDQHALAVLEPHADSPDPNPEALYLLAAAHMRLGHHTTALALVDRALAIRYAHAGQHYLALLVRLTEPFRDDDGHRERRREHVAWLEPGFRKGLPRRGDGECGLRAGRLWRARGQRPSQAWRPHGGVASSAGVGAVGHRAHVALQRVRCRLSRASQQRSGGGWGRAAR